jgi:hypothetical protein
MASSGYIETVYARVFLEGMRGKEQDILEALAKRPKVNCKDARGW